MIRSELILPIRFYDDLNNQNRFNKFCESDFHSYLIYPSRQLPHFQIKRSSSLASPTRLFLRNICSDISANFYKAIPQGINNFAVPGAINFYGGLPSQVYIYDNGIDPPDLRNVNIGEIDCSHLKSIVFDNPDFYTPSGILIPEINIPIVECKVRVKISVEKFIRSIGSTFEINLYDGANLVGTIISPGSYNFDYFPTTSIATIKFENFTPGDLFEIDYVQAETLDIYCFQIYNTDVLLDQTKIKIVQLNNGNDVLVYCEGETNYNIKPGDYYYAVQCEDSRTGFSEYYFSEVFTIKNVKDIENYYRIKWYNSCDIENNVIYNFETIECNYFNSVFLDAGLFKPEYPTTVDIVTDGSAEETALFKKWEKNKTLEIFSPEFLTDALSAIFIHDNIYLLEPINKSEEFQKGEYRIKRIEQDISDVLSDCYQKVNLKLLIFDNFTKTNCCTNADTFGEGFRFRATEDCDDDHQYKLQLTDPPESTDGLRRCSDDGLVPVKKSDIILNDTDDRYYRLKLEGGIYSVLAKMPTIAHVILSDDSLTYTITGIILPNSFGLLEYKYEALDWADSHLTATTDETGIFSLDMPASLVGGATAFKIRIHDVTISKDLGLSDEYTILP